MNSSINNTFSKSCSIEDIPQKGSIAQMSSGQNSQMVYNSIVPSTSCRPIHKHSNQSQNDSRDDVNLHQKLRRQLTLNPSGSDPRIFHMQQQIKMQSPKPENSDHGHRLLECSVSGPRTNISNHWDLHQVNINRKNKNKKINNFHLK